MIPATFLLGLSDVFTKKILREKIPETLLLGFNFFFSGIILSVVSLAVGFPEIKPAFWTAFVATVAINVFGQFSWYRAYKLEEVSLVSPLRLIIPAFVILTGFFILNETPNFWGMAGIFITIFGLWLLFYSQANFTGRSMSKTIISPGVLWGLAGVVSFSFSFPFDKKAVINSSALFFSGFAFLALGLIYLFITFVARKDGAAKIKELYKMKKYFLSMIFFYSFGGFLATWALNFALAAYASSTKRLQSLWTVIFGGKILKEGNIGKKIVATIIMFLGIAVSLIFG